MAVIVVEVVDADRWGSSMACFRVGGRLTSLIIAAVMITAGCGHDSVVAGSASASASAEAEAAYAQMKQAGEPIHCSDAATDIGRLESDTRALRAAAQEYRQLNAAYDQKLSGITFPGSVRPTVNELRLTEASLLHDLDMLAVVTNREDVDALVRYDYYDDTMASALINQIYAQLGHPTPEGKSAADQLELARHTAARDSAWVHTLVATALAANDLPAAQAANAIEEKAYQRYVERLGTIIFPGGFSDRVAELQSLIRQSIGADSEQFNVETVAQVPPQKLTGSLETPEAKKAEFDLYDELVAVDAIRDDKPNC
jgi:hypothetical protein